MTDFTKFADIPAGRIIAFTTGEYSSYEIITLCEAVKPIPADIIRRYGHDQTGKRPGYDAHRCVGRLVKEGYLKEVDFIEMHIGEYGRYKRYDNTYDLNETLKWAGFASEFSLMDDDL